MSGGPVGADLAGPVGAGRERETATFSSISTRLQCLKMVSGDLSDQKTPQQAAAFGPWI